MKKRRLAALFLGAVMGVSAFAGLVGCGEGDTEDAYDITVWCSEVEGVKEQFEKQIKAFNEQSTKYTFNATVRGIQEGEAATTVLTDVESAPDIYCFAQDQLARLVLAGALAQPGTKATETIKSSHDTTSVKAATCAGSVYCYPLTADNGYFMYYDKSVIKETSVGSLEALISDCEEAGRNFSFNLGGSGWYNASFFFATGCKSEWTTDKTGKFVSVEDSFNSSEGIIALRGMQKLLKSSCYNDSNKGSDFNAAVKSAVVISGTWEKATIQGILGDNMGVAKLPSFNVDGKDYQLGSFTGNKLLGVKPQGSGNEAKAAGLQELALYLTNKDCQLQRFNSFGWGPSNKEAQQDSAVKADAVLAALSAQNVYGTPQGNIHGSWWDAAIAYAAAAKNATLDDTEALQDALDAYDAELARLLKLTDAQLRAFTVIGIGGDWSTDYAMVENPENTWISEDAFGLKAGDEFKCRQGVSWTVSYGAADGGNYKVEEAGTYKIKLVTTVADGKVTGGTITLVKQ